MIRFTLPDVILPEFNEHGDLPPEIYRISLSEAVNHFGTSTPKREAIAVRLRRIYEIARATEHLKRFIVFGSFVTEKLDPNDIDIFLIMDDDFDVTQVNPSASVLFDHPSAQSHYGASVFWVRAMAALGGEEAAIKDWMRTRKGHNRGIIELTLTDW